MYIVTLNPVLLKCQKALWCLVVLLGRLSSDDIILT